LFLFVEKKRESWVVPSSSSSKRVVSKKLAQIFFFFFFFASKKRRQQGDDTQKNAVPETERPVRGQPNDGGGFGVGVSRAEKKPRLVFLFFLVFF
tara:strand:- start:264 stop:548 length:285 start_codon:yes stop_codon:yes gene_type:complete